jgi:hypothetical protein
MNARQMIQIIKQVLHPGYILPAKRLISTQALFSSDPNTATMRAPATISKNCDQVQPYNSQSIEMESQI